MHRPATALLAATALTALAACSSASSTQPAAFQPAGQVTLACNSILPNGLWSDDVAALAAADRSIHGAWTAAESAGVTNNANPTAAQTKADDALTAAEPDLGTAALARGPLAAAASRLDDAVSRMTFGTPTTATGAAVHAGITALAAKCR